ncbi:MAG: sensor histidine kinase, partial [Ekhidna sp.]
MRKYRNHLIGAILIFLLGGVINSVLLCSSCLDEPFFLSRGFFITFCYSGLAWTSFWKGSEFLVDFLDNRIPWVEAPLKRFIISLVSSCLFVFLVVWALDLFFDVLLFNKTLAETFTDSGIPFWDALMITLGINVFMHGRAFLYSWRQAAIDVEKLRAEQLSTQYESLKNQVNPHFLFNSLNALTSLVYDDQEKAVEFIRKLSQVYRYVLDKKDEELVPFSDDLDFARNYIFLQKIRFGDNLHISVKGEAPNKYVPPLAIQLLVENAIKHNVIS